MKGKTLFAVLSAAAVVATALAALGPGCVVGGAMAGHSALREMFPAARKVRELVPGEGWPPECRVFVAERRAGPAGYEVHMQVVSRSGPFMIMAIIGRDLQVRRAMVLTYTAERGADIQMPKFTRQFTGKGPKDPIRVGKDIDAITGATLSSKAMSGGVRNAIRLVRKLAASSQ